MKAWGWEMAFDLAIFGAYFSLPAQLTYFLHKQQAGTTSRAVQLVIGMYAAFITLCGCSHLVVNFQVDDLTTAVKGVTALVSWLTAIVTLRVAPQMLAMPHYASTLEREVVRSQRDVDVAKRETETVARSKSEFEAFMAFVCHEIRNPLQVVTGNTEFLLDTDLTEDQLEYCQSLGTAAKLIVSIVNDVLDLSRLDAGKMQLERVCFDLPELVFGVVKSLRSQALAKRLVLDVRVSDKVPRLVLSDARRMHQILLNLAGNAVKYTNAGHVTVNVEAELLAPAGPAGQPITLDPNTGAVIGHTGSSGSAVGDGGGNNALAQPDSGTGNIAKLKARRSAAAGAAAAEASPPPVPGATMRVSPKTGGGVTDLGAVVDAGAGAGAGAPSALGSVLRPAVSPTGVRVHAAGTAGAALSVGASSMVASSGRTPPPPAFAAFPAAAGGAVSLEMTAGPAARNGTGSGRRSQSGGNRNAAAAVPEVRVTPPGSAGAAGALAAAASQLTSAGPRHVVTISVTDSGIGIDDALRPFVFTPFSQGQMGSVLRKQAGTGLGLSIVKRLVGAMGGHISFTSVFGRGTTFVVKMPLEEDVSGMAFTPLRADPSAGLTGDDGDVGGAAAGLGLNTGQYLVPSPGGAGSHRSHAVQAPAAAMGPGMSPSSRGSGRGTHSRKSMSVRVPAPTNTNGVLTLTIAPPAAQGSPLPVVPAIVGVGADGRPIGGMDLDEKTSRIGAVAASATASAPATSSHASPGLDASTAIVIGGPITSASVTPPRTDIALTVLPPPASAAADSASPPAAAAGPDTGPNRALLHVAVPANGAAVSGGPSPLGGITQRTSPSSVLSDGSPAAGLSTAGHSWRGSTTSTGGLNTGFRSSASSSASGVTAPVQGYLQHTSTPTPSVNATPGSASSGLPPASPNPMGTPSVGAGVMLNADTVLSASPAMPLDGTPAPASTPGPVLPGQTHPRPSEAVNPAHATHPHTHLTVGLPGDAGAGALYGSGAVRPDVAAILATIPATTTNAHFTTTPVSMQQPMGGAAGPHLNRTWSQPPMALADALAAIRASGMTGQELQQHLQLGAAAGIPPAHPLARQSSLPGAGPPAVPHLSMPGSRDSALIPAPIATPGSAAGLTPLQTVGSSGSSIATPVPGSGGALDKRASAVAAASALAAFGPASANSSSSGSSSGSASAKASSKRPTIDPRRCILCVDDQELNTKVIVRMANTLGFACDVATGGHQAIEKVRARGFGSVAATPAFLNAIGAPPAVHALAAAAAAGPHPLPQPASESTHSSTVSSSRSSVSSAASMGSLGALGAVTQFGPSGAPNYPYKLILMDINMPSMSGIDAARGIRAMGCRTPIIALTGSSRPQERSEARDAGMDDFVAKPIRRNDLLKLMHMYDPTARSGGGSGRKPGASRSSASHGAAAGAGAGTGSGSVTPGSLALPVSAAYLYPGDATPPAGMLTPPGAMSSLGSALLQHVVSPSSVSPTSADATARAPAGTNLALATRMSLSPVPQSGVGGHTPSQGSQAGAVATPSAQHVGFHSAGLDSSTPLAPLPLPHNDTPTFGIRTISHRHSASAGGAAYMSSSAVGGSGAAPLMTTNPFAISTHAQQLPQHPLPPGPAGSHSPMTSHGLATAYASASHHTAAALAAAGVNSNSAIQRRPSANAAAGFSTHSSTSGSTAASSFGTSNAAMSNALMASPAMVASNFFSTPGAMAAMAQAEASSAQALPAAVVASHHHRVPGTGSRSGSSDRAGAPGSGDRHTRSHGGSHSGGSTGAGSRAMAVSASLVAAAAGGSTTTPQPQGRFDHAPATASAAPNSAHAQSRTPGVSVPALMPPPSSGYHSASGSGASTPVFGAAGTDAYLVPALGAGGIPSASGSRSGSLNPQPQPISPPSDGRGDSPALAARLLRNPQHTSSGGSTGAPAAAADVSYRAGAGHSAYAARALGAGSSSGTGTPGSTDEESALLRGSGRATAPPVTAAAAANKESPVIAERRLMPHSTPSRGGGPHGGASHTPSPSTSVLHGEPVSRAQSSTLSAAGIAMIMSGSPAAATPAGAAAGGAAVSPLLLADAHAYPRSAGPT